MCEDGTVHLVGGDDVSRGRVEYCYQGTWYSVCASGWGERGEEAEVVCKTLGYSFGMYNTGVKKTQTRFCDTYYGFTLCRISCCELWTRKQSNSTTEY